ncbi:hypothetical protein HMI54_006709, partial [Coelomomyces lativittatus]
MIPAVPGEVQNNTFMENVVNMDVDVESTPINNSTLVEESSTKVELISTDVEYIISGPNNNESIRLSSFVTVGKQFNNLILPQVNFTLFKDELWEAQNKEIIYENNLNKQVKHAGCFTYNETFHRVSDCPGVNAVVANTALVVNSKKENKQHGVCSINSFYSTSFLNKIKNTNKIKNDSLVDYFYFIIDSGCTFHILGSSFSKIAEQLNYENCETRDVLSASGQLCRGFIFKNINFSLLCNDKVFGGNKSYFNFILNILYVPSFSENLFSVCEALENNFKFEFEKDLVKIYFDKNKIFEGKKNSDDLWTIKLQYQKEALDMQNSFVHLNEMKYAYKTQVNKIHLINNVEPLNEYLQNIHEIYGHCG